MSSPNVRAILNSTKTQTRRVVNGAPDDWAPMQPRVFSPTVIDRHGDEQPGPDAYGAGNEDGDFWICCPYGKPGDSLWVREAFRVGKTHDAVKPSDLPHERGLTVAFAAGGSRAHGKDGTYVNDNVYPVGRPEWLGRLRPGIFMPRWASRITLKVTGVRIERLKDISEADAIAEGIEQVMQGRWRIYGKESDGHDMDASPRTSYCSLWEQINGAGSWAANPWVWIIEFKRVQ